MNSSNLIYVVIILLKLKNISIININLSFSKKNTFSKNVKDFSISPYISHPQCPPLQTRKQSLRYLIHIKGDKIIQSVTEGKKKGLNVIIMLSLQV